MYHQRAGEGAAGSSFIDINKRPQGTVAEAARYGWDYRYLWRIVKHFRLRIAVKDDLGCTPKSGEHVHLSEAVYRVVNLDKYVGRTEICVADSLLREICMTEPVSSTESRCLSTLLIGSSWRRSADFGPDAGQDETRVLDSSLGPSEPEMLQGWH